MTIEDIIQIIKGGETKNLELKKRTGELKDGMHSACAFLNTDGGWLLFGITPVSLKIAGQQVTDKTRQEIAQAMQGINPTVDVPVEYIDLPDKAGFQIIAMHFKSWKWGSETYTYQGCPYIRVESTTRIMQRDIYNERIMAANPDKFAWECQTAKDLNIEDLDESKIRGVVRLGVDANRINASAMLEPVNVILSKWKLLKNGKPNNGAAALFIRDSHEYFQFGIRMARFRGTDKYEFLDNQRTEGNFFELLDAGMTFLMKHLSISGKIVGLHRKDQMEIPTEALREALINCLCHRAMEQFRATPSIAIFDDRVEISNPGKFIAGITPENIKQPHGSFPYNPLIASVLFQSTFLESWGSGVERILKVCQKNNTPEPYYSTSPDFVTITFPRPLNNNDGEINGEVNGEVNGEHGILSARQINIIKFLKTNGTHTSMTLSALLGVSQRTVQREISFLRNTGFIDKEGAAKTGVWKVLK